MEASGGYSGLARPVTRVGIQLLRRRWADPVWFVTSTPKFSVSTRFVLDSDGLRYLRDRGRTDPSVGTAGRTACLDGVAGRKVSWR